MLNSQCVLAVEVSGWGWRVGMWYCKDSSGGSGVMWTESKKAGEHRCRRRRSNAKVVRLTFPGLHQHQRAPVAPLALVVDVIASPDLDLVKVSSQSVRDHHGTLHGVELRGGRAKLKVVHSAATVSPFSEVRSRKANCSLRPSGPRRAGLLLPFTDL